jgi:hypothetical protein
MKTVIAAIVVVLSISATAQQRVVISSASTIPQATIAAEMQKYCKGVQITADLDAPLIITASFTGWNWGAGSCSTSPYSGATSCSQRSGTPDAGAAVTLVDKHGTVLYAKQTRAIKNAFKDVCKDYLNKK